MNVRDDRDSMSASKVGSLLSRFVPTRINQQNLSFFDSIEIEILQVNEEVLLRMHHKRALAAGRLHHNERNARFAIGDNMHLGGPDTIRLQLFENCMTVLIVCNSPPKLGGPAQTLRSY